MGLWDNEKIKNSIVKKKRIILIGVGIIIIALLSYSWALKIVKDSNKDVIELEKVIMEKSNSSKENKKVKLTIYGAPYQIASNDGNDQGFYVVAGKKYLYVVKMNTKDAAKYKNNDTEKGAELIGYTSSVPSEVKGFAIDAYNKFYEDKLETPLIVADYEKIFGDVCIDLVKVDTVVAPLQYSVFYIGLFTGIFLIIIGIVSVLSYKKRIKIVNVKDGELLNEEINSSEAIYFEKGQIYLTKNYLVDIAGLQYFKYKDILWVYKHIQRVNGFVSYKVLMLYTTNCKQYMVAMNAKDNYEKIMEELVLRNNNIRIGYNKENRQYLKEYKKELKEKKKKSIQGDE